MIEIVMADYSDPIHREATLKLLDAYARDPMGGGEPLPQSTRDSLLDEMAARPHIFTILALVDGKPAGIANCIESFSTFAAKPLVNIHDIAVLPEFRGRGIARAMLLEVEAAGRARGCCKLTLEVLQGNDVARAAYLGFGFKPYRLDEKLGCAEFWQKYLDHS